MLGKSVYFHCFHSTLTDISDLQLVDAELVKPKLIQSSYTDESTKTERSQGENIRIGLKISARSQDCVVGFGFCSHELTLLTIQKS